MSRLSQALDNLIADVAPGWAVQRARSRAVLAFSDAYQGASFSRAGLGGFNPAGYDADGAISTALPTLRARSRDLARNSPVAGGALNTQVTYVVGTGLSLKPAIDAELLGLSPEQAAAWELSTQRRFNPWAASTDCDLTRTQNFYGLQALAFRGALEAGDIFALMGAQSITGREQLAVQMIEGDRCCNPDNKPDDAGLVAGIERDASGAPQTYHFCSGYPNAYTATLGQKLTWNPVQAFGAASGRRNVIHLYERKRPGQSRGVPYLAAVIEPIKQLSRYTDAELQAAVISGAFAVFIKMDPEAFQDLFADPATRDTYLQGAMGWDGQYAGMSDPGKAVNLLPGESVDTSNPGRPNAAFDPFVMAIFRQIGMALDLPFEVLIKHYTASYSAARAALLDAWRFFNVRRDFLASYFCQPIYEEWLALEVAAGRISAPGYFADPLIRAAYSGAQWIGDGMGSIDPTKDVDAAERRIALTISTREKESILHDGEDWNAKARQLGREEKLLRGNGISAQPAAPQTPQNSQGSQPNPNQAETGDLEIA